MNVSYFDSKNEKSCTGCRACEVICPRGAIHMAENSEGFLYPEICEDKCIRCNLCRDRCPLSFKFRSETPKEVYAAQIKSKDVLLKSSSGGIFGALAQYVIERSGAVYGCVFDDNNNAIIKRTTSYDGVLPMHGSKYVSSDTKNTFAEAKEDLENGLYVLYTGTPCQTAGLLNFLNREYPRLITMDFLCHGVPSGKIFREYVAYLEKTEGAKISDYKFRDKSKKGWGMVASFKVQGKKKYVFGDENCYVSGFLKGYFNRFSCYDCQFTGTQRSADFTVADYWGIRNFHSEFKAEDGVSILLANTDKAGKIIGSLKESIVLYQSRIEDMGIENPSLIHSGSEKVPPTRNEIYHDLSEYGFAHIKKHSLDIPFSLKRYIKNRVPQGFKTTVRRIVRM